GGLERVRERQLSSCLPDDREERARALELYTERACVGARAEGLRCPNAEGREAGELLGARCIRRCVKQLQDGSRRPAERERGRDPAAARKRLRGHGAQRPRLVEGRLSELTHGREVQLGREAVRARKLEPVVRQLP